MTTTHECLATIQALTRAIPELSAARVYRSDLSSAQIATIERVTDAADDARAVLIAAGWQV